MNVEHVSGYFQIGRWISELIPMLPLIKEGGKVNLVREICVE